MKKSIYGLVRDIQGSLSDFARACTRYNKDVVTDKLAGHIVTCHSTKLVVSDFNNLVSRFSTTSFSLKIMQIIPDTNVDMNDDVLSTLVDAAITSIGAGDMTFKPCRSDSDSLKYSGLNSSYVYALQSVAACVAGVGGSKIQYFASATFSNPCVGMVFSLDNQVFILQLTD